jgi:hypothetical protein
MGGPERAPQAPRAPRPGGAGALRECRGRESPAERPGSAGARSVGGVGGHVGAPHQGKETL